MALILSKKSRHSFGLNLILIIISLAMLFPSLWMILLSLKNTPEQFDTFKDLFFSDFTAKNYTFIIDNENYSLYFFNSLLVAVLVTLGNLLFCSMVGYGLARYKSKLVNIVLISVTLVLMIPPHVVMIPLYRTMVNFSWINSYFALIVPWLVTPFGVFLMRQYALGLPREVEDAARIDGASQWGVFFRIVLPLMKPALLVLGVYIFLGNWNSFLFPFLFTNDTQHRTLPVALAFFLGKQSVDWGSLMAAASIAALPVIFLFIFFQKHIIKGLTSGSLKEV